MKSSITSSVSPCPSCDPHWQAPCRVLPCQDQGDGRDENKDYVLLLDIRMPKVDGVEILRRMNAGDELRDIPVLMVTTSDARANIEMCTRLGCKGYLVKPLDETLIETVRQLCRHMCTHPRAGR